MRTVKEIDFQFNPVPFNQMSEGQKHRALKITKRFQEMAEEILDLVQPSENRDRIMRHVLDAKFWSIQEITHEGVPSGKEETKTNPGQKTPGQVQGAGPSQTSPQA